jgi:hypothetical protein
MLLGARLLRCNGVLRRRVFLALGAYVNALFRFAHIIAARSYYINDHSPRSPTTNSFAFLNPAELHLLLPMDLLLLIKRVLCMTGRHVMSSFNIADTHTLGKVPREHNKLLKSRKAVHCRFSSSMFGDLVPSKPTTTIQTSIINY